MRLEGTALLGRALVGISAVGRAFGAPIGKPLGTRLAGMNPEGTPDIGTFGTIALVGSALVGTMAPVGTDGIRLLGTRLAGTNPDGTPPGIRLEGTTLPGRALVGSNAAGFKPVGTALVGTADGIRPLGTRLAGINPEGTPGI